MAAERASKPRVLLIPPATQASRVTHVINDRFSLVLFLKKKKKPSSRSVYHVGHKYGIILSLYTCLRSLEKW